MGFNGGYKKVMDRVTIYPDKELQEKLNKEAVAPREVVYPSCQKKKDNHTSPQEVNVSEPQHKGELGEAPADEEPELDIVQERSSSSSGSDIQQSKIFEDVIDWINNWEVSKSTGDFMFINNKERLGEYPDEWLQDLKLKIKEKWGKIER